MKDRISDVMTSNPVTLQSASTLSDAARAMRDSNIGDVIVLDDDGQICGIVTDRDIVIRALAEDRQPGATTLGDICSRDPVTLSSGDSVKDAIQLMSEKAVRRVPVVDGGKPVGIVTIGDLAIDRDPDSALADISEAKPNR
jgi:signal-transduction protein with cAMP-binding, CBS, and nucleotidyltransferase domain